MKVQGQAAHYFYPGEDWLTSLQYVHEVEKDMIAYRRGKVCRVVSLYNNTVLWEFIRSTGPASIHPKASVNLIT